MNVEMGTEAVQFTEKEYINGIFVAVLEHPESIIKIIQNSILNRPSV